jgi:hypothetical protein
LFELDCLSNYAASFKKKSVKEFKDSGFTDDFGVNME